ncbi:hypothetical protein GCM10023093_05290 [Nemorincola caseinilytica]|uniref:Uncharacterized protein n=1 Tax=Nemorincola caseinilytica TaxID=2054315 RepID=A0ABP8N7B5_9BACT
MRQCIVLACGILSLCGGTAVAKDKKRPVRNRALYLSWGYNTAWYTRSTVKIDQPALASNYEMVKVKAHDNPGWNHRLFHQQLTIPQYNYRLGMYFNKKQDLAIEINFDHVKYIIADEQDMQLKGMLNGVNTNENIRFSGPKGFYYFLNNGANFFCFNIVKRVGLYTTKDRNLYVDLTGKAGIGPVVPHVENSLFGKKNDKGFQLGGWNTGLETALRVTFMRYAYFEFAQKVDYARYSHLKVYEGRARQAFGTYELILSLGAILPTTRNNPLFTRIPETHEDVAPTAR